MQLGRAQDSFDAHAHSLTLDEDDTYARRGIGPLSPARPLEQKRTREKKKDTPARICAGRRSTAAFRATGSHKTNSRQF